MHSTEYIADEMYIYTECILLPMSFRIYLYFMTMIKLENI